MNKPTIIREVPDLSTVPWQDGETYADVKVYLDHIENLEQRVRYAVDDLIDVMEWLRESKHYAEADRLRTIVGRLNEANRASRSGLWYRKDAVGYK